MHPGEAVSPEEFPPFHGNRVDPPIQVEASADGGCAVGHEAVQHGKEVKSPRNCRQRIKSPSEVHVWSLRGNYCQERITDRSGGATFETISTIIAINSSTSLLQGVF